MSTSKGSDPVPQHRDMSTQQRLKLPEATSNQWVILIHGLASHRLLLTPLARALKREGFHSLTWGYESLLRPIGHPAERFRIYLSELASRSDVATIHLVAHSMGNLIARYALGKTPLHKIHRFVMLAPPNQGSHVARRVRRFLEAYFPPIAQLSDEPDSWVRTLCDVPAPIEIGIIAARYDLVVAQSAIQLPRCPPCVTVATTHTGLLFSRETARFTIRFLQTGKFHD